MSHCQSSDTKTARVSDSCRLETGEWLQYPSLLARQFMCYTRFVSIPFASPTSPTILGPTQTKANEKKATSVISPSDGRQFGLLQ